MAEAWNPGNFWKESKECVGLLWAIIMYYMGPKQPCLVENVWFGYFRFWIVFSLAKKISDDSNPSSSTPNPLSYSPVSAYRMLLYYYAAFTMIIKIKLSYRASTATFLACKVSSFLDWKA